MPPGMHPPQPDGQAAGAGNGAPAQPQQPQQPAQQPPQPFNFYLPPMPQMPMPPPGSGFDMNSFMQQQQMRDKMLFDWMQQMNMAQSAAAAHGQQISPIDMLKSLMPIISMFQQPAAMPPQVQPTAQEKQDLNTAFAMLAEAKQNLVALEGLFKPAEAAAVATAAQATDDDSPVQIITGPDGTPVAIDKKSGNIKYDQTIVMALPAILGKVLEGFDKIRDTQFAVIDRKEQASARLLAQQRGEAYQPPPPQIPPQNQQSAPTPPTANTDADDLQRIFSEGD